MSRTRSDGSRAVAPGGAQKQVKAPSLRQRQVLDAYYELPNAAAVGRALRISERQVRRIVEQFRPQLDERRRHEQEELAERTAARRAKVAAWADKAQRENLDALDELVRSPKEDVRLRTIKLRQALIDRQALGTALPSDVELALVEKEHEAADHIRHIGLRSTDAEEVDGE